MAAFNQEEYNERVRLAHEGSAVAIRKLVESTVMDLVTDLFYYDRKDDEEMSVELFEKWYDTGIITDDFLMECFKKGLIEK